MTISCSYLSSNDEERVINELNKTNVDYIHLDIMDGKFTENETLDFNTLRNYFYENTKKLDVHLMVKDVKLYTELYSLLNPEYITFHLEIGNTKELINYVKNKNIKVGLAINPNTDIKEIRKINKDIIISVDGGINNTNINKIKEAGASICVVGSYITNNNIKEKIEELKNV